MTSRVIPGTAEHGICARLTARILSRAAEHGIRSGFWYPFRFTYSSSASSCTLHGLGPRGRTIVSPPYLTQNLRILFLKLFKIDIKILDLDSSHWQPP